MFLIAKSAKQSFLEISTAFAVSEVVNNINSKIKNGALKLLAN